MVLLQFLVIKFVRTGEGLSKVEECPIILKIAFQFDSSSERKSFHTKLLQHCHGDVIGVASSQNGQGKNWQTQGEMKS